MPYDPDLHHRRSVRLPGFDYTQPGAYFVTICTHERECFLSKIVDGETRLSEDGEIVRVQWMSISQYHPYVELDEFVIMPNHVHGIIILKDDSKWAGLLTRPYKKQGIPDLVRGFKTYSAKQINKRLGRSEVPVWQRDYYEHIVRNEDELTAIREYIVNNPGKWEEDQDHPAKRNPGE